MKLTTSHRFVTTSALALTITASVASAQSASFTIIPAQNTQSYSVWARGVSADGSVVVVCESGSFSTATTTYQVFSAWSITC